MKEHFNDYEERMLKMMEESAREMDEVLGDGWDEELDERDRELSDRMDEKLFGRIRDYEERMKKREEEKCAEAHAGATDAEMSEEDLEALRLGRELQERRRKEEERKAERRKWAPWKRVVAAVVVIAILGGVGVQSQGGAEKIVEKIRRTHEYKEEEKVISSKEEVRNVISKEEEQAYEQVKEELQIDPVRILRTNDEMEYLTCEVDQELRTAFLLYECEGNTISYIMNCTYTEDTWGIMFEDEKVDEYEYTGKKASIYVEKYVVADSEDEQWVATFVYQGVYYCLTGHMKQEMFEDLLKKLFFP